MTTEVEVMSQERIDHYIDVAVKTIDYPWFGVRGCDLDHGDYWATSDRQSLREQAQNNRLGEYFITDAKLAKQECAVVPREYVFYDTDSSEDFNRPGMIRLRQLIALRRIVGVIIPEQGRLSMTPLHQMTFERECEYYGVRIVYGDAPGGNDWGSQTTRLMQAQANRLRVLSNRKNALEGNTSRVRNGKVPAGKADYGYKYCCKDEIDQRGRRRILDAWWELDIIDADGEIEWGSDAYVVNNIFPWLGDESRTQYWVAHELNTLHKANPSLFRPLYGPVWTPKMIGEIAMREAYTGKGVFNKNSREPNPKKPLGDLTLGVKRTLLRPKPASERIYFTVPALTTQECWERANRIIKERGRGRGKQGKSV